MMSTSYRADRRRDPAPIHRADGCGASSDLSTWPACVVGPGFLRSHRCAIVYDLRLYFRPMDVEYDPEREAFAAMKLAAEADGAERQRWINAALAWIELTRLQGPADRERVGRKEAV